MKTLNNLQKFVVLLMIAILILCIAILKSINEIESKFEEHQENIQKTIKKSEINYKYLSMIVKEETINAMEEFKEKEVELKKELADFSGSILNETDVKYMIFLDDLKKYEKTRKNPGFIIDAFKEVKLNRFNSLKEEFPKLSDVEIIKLMNNK